jgi:hypothetical protein
MHIARVKCNMGESVAFQLAPIKQLTSIQLLTQPPRKCALSGWGSRCTLTIREAGCTLTIEAAECTPTIGAAGCTLMVGPAGCGLVGAGGVQGLCPRGLRYALLAWALQDLKLAGKLKCNMYSILHCNMHVTRAICILHKYPYCV